MSERIKCCKSKTKMLPVGHIGNMVFPIWPSIENRSVWKKWCVIFLC